MLIAALAVARSVSAEQPESARVVAIAPDPHLEHAVSIALTSWHIEVVSAEGPTPGRDLDDAIRTAHRIARSSGARAVVWIARNTAPDETFSLWVYDDRAHAIAIRPLPAPPPYDDETAAAIALSVKTLLSSAFEREATHSSLPDEETPKPKPKPPSSASSFRIHTLGGVRIPTNASDVLAARVGAELTFFPSLFDRRIGVAVGIDAGPSVLVDHPPYFAGTFTDTIASAMLRWRIPLRSWFALELGAGPGLHFSAIEGSAPLLGLSGRVTRTDGSVETLVGFELAWKILRVAPLVGSSFLVHYQHYRVNQTQVLDVPTAQLFYALRVGVEIP